MLLETRLIRHLSRNPDGVRHSDILRYFRQQRIAHEATEAALLTLEESGFIHSARDPKDKKYYTLARLDPRGIHRLIVSRIGPKPELSRITRVPVDADFVARYMDDWHLAEYSRQLDNLPAIEPDPKQRKNMEKQLRDKISYLRKQVGDRPNAILEKSSEGSAAANEAFRESLAAWETAFAAESARIHDLAKKFQFPLDS